MSYSYSKKFYFLSLYYTFELNTKVLRLFSFPWKLELLACTGTTCKRNQEAMCTCVQCVVFCLTCAQFTFHCTDIQFFGGNFFLSFISHLSKIYRLLFSFPWKFEVLARTGTTCKPIVARIQEAMCACVQGAVFCLSCAHSTSQ